MSELKNIKTFNINAEKLKLTQIDENEKFIMKKENYIYLLIKIHFSKIVYLTIIFISISLNIILFFQSINENLFNSKLYYSINKTLEQKELDEFIIDGNHEVPSKILKYIIICRFGFLLYKENLVLSENPKISVIIPVYNRENYISNAVRSCQNQKMKDIEIIIVDDLSTDNSIKIIKELTKEDPRIQLITNKKRKGTFNNRYVGIFQAKGKYITYLDSDDLFIRDDLFDKIYNEAEQGNYDVVSFDGFHSKNFKMNKKRLTKFKYTHAQDITIIQPKLSDLIYKFKGKIERSPHDQVVWARLVKRIIMLKAFELLGPKIYNKFWVRNEDVMTSYALFKIAKNYKNIKFIGIYILWGNKKYENNKKKESFIKKYKPVEYLNWIEALLNMVKKYPNDEDILLKELFRYQKYFKNCFYKEFREKSISILKDILGLNNFEPKTKNKINYIINKCSKTNN